MLFFIQCRERWLFSIFPIQIHLMLFFIEVCTFYAAGFPDSNTSHVILYPIRRRRICTVIYHSNTSHVILYLVDKEIFKMYNIFKYISCYSLSDSHCSLQHIHRYSNTSHVILYPDRSSCWDACH